MNFSEIFQISAGEIRGSLLTLFVMFIAFLINKLWQKTGEKIWDFLKMVSLILPLFLGYAFFEFMYSNKEFPPKVFTVYFFLLVVFFRWYLDFLFQRLENGIKVGKTEEKTK